MVTTVIIAIVCFAVGGGLSYMLFRYGLKSKYDIIIKEAQTEAEVIKKNKLLEVKEKFLNKKADLEKEVALRNQKIQQAENKLKQRELMLNQKQEEVQRKRTEAEAIKENLEAQIVIVDKKKEELDKLQMQEREKLEALSGLSAEEAKERLVDSLKEEAKTQAASYINDIMDDAKLTANQKANSLRIQPGDVKWKDVNGDGIIDNYDMVKVGNTVPKWTGGINTSVTWKDLTLSARFDYALGFKAVDWKTMWIMSCAQGTYNTIAETHDTWSPENPGAQYPTYVWADQLGKRNYCRQSSMFAYNGNYLSFREIALSYNLPSNWVRKAGLGSVMLSVTGQNLGYLTEAKHLFSPEKTDNNGGYPLPRTVILGVNVSF